MADFLTWRDEWRTGIDWIDGDHRELGALLNQLVAVNERAVQGVLPPYPGVANGGVLVTLDALITLTRRHFVAEESFLRGIRFPGYDAHRCEHELQLAEFVDLRRTLAEAPGQCLGAETMQDFKRWFFNHVMAEDRDYVDYYQEHLARGSQRRADSAPRG
jgi:hemerythrin